MDREAQQKIMGFFVLESREHLETIERGLPSLPHISDNKDLIDCLYRGAHSIKGGAAMLGIGSIQVTSLHMENAFKALKERGLDGDETLESLLRRCSDTLAGLVDRLESPEGLSSEGGNAELAKLEPVFQQLELHTKVLLGEISAEAAAAHAVIETPPLTPIPSEPEPIQPSEIAASTPIPSEPEPIKPTDVLASTPIPFEPKLIRPRQDLPETREFPSEPEPSQSAEVTASTPIPSDPEPIQPTEIASEPKELPPEPEPSLPTEIAASPPIPSEPEPIQSTEVVTPTPIPPHLKSFQSKEVVPSTPLPSQPVPRQPIAVTPSIPQISPPPKPTPQSKTTPSSQQRSIQPQSIQRPKTSPVPLKRSPQPAPIQATNGSPSRSSNQQEAKQPASFLQSFFRLIKAILKLIKRMFIRH